MRLTRPSFNTPKGSAPSLERRLGETQGRPSGFDYMRIVLAVAVIASHSVMTTSGQAANSALFMTPLRPLMRAIVPMFFVLSGFLVAGSLERCRTLLSFMGLRLIRIYPALAVEVILSAFVIGLSITTVSPKIYLQSHEFQEYLLNAIGDIHYVLPGVFVHNPYPIAVNAQLWTIPYELGCYITLALLTAFDLVRRPVLAPIAAFAICVLHLGYRLLKYHGHLPFILGGIPGALLIVSFLLGITLYLYRERVPWNGRLCAVSVLASALLLSVPDGEYLGVTALSYVTIWLGLTNFRRLVIIRGADLSYGAYLYGFVIQQLFSYLFPQYRYWWASIMVCVPCALAFAAVSWNLIEKPALKLRRPLMVLEAVLFPSTSGLFLKNDVSPSDVVASRDV